MSRSAPLRVLQCGLGPIGLGVTREIAARRDLALVGAVDPAHAGADLGLLAGLPGPLKIPVFADPAGLLERVKADVAVVTTTSKIGELVGQIRPLIAAGLSVVSSCEELAYPFHTHPAAARELDELARHNGVSVLGTGVNPGFLMDFWALTATALTRRVDAVRIDRIQDAGRRRVPFQVKIGVGLTPEAFASRVAEGTLRHVGLAESMYLIADGLGWELDRVEDEVTPVLAGAPVVAGDLRVEKGCAAGVEQVGRGLAGGREVLTLRFRAAVGEGVDRDVVRIEGEPSLTVEIPGGVNGDAATCSILAHACRAVTRARPGLRHMADVPLLVGRGG